MQAPVYSVGGGIVSPALSSVFVALRSLVPERFRGGCAFGGGSTCKPLSPAGVDRCPAGRASRQARSSGAICRQEEGQVNGGRTRRPFSLWSDCFPCT